MLWEDALCLMISWLPVKPGLIIYVLDVSASMTQLMGGEDGSILLWKPLAGYPPDGLPFTKGTRVQPVTGLVCLPTAPGLRFVGRIRTWILWLTWASGTDHHAQHRYRSGFYRSRAVINRELQNLGPVRRPGVPYYDGEYTGADPGPSPPDHVDARPGWQCPAENIFISDTIWQPGSIILACGREFSIH